MVGELYHATVYCLCILAVIAGGLPRVYHRLVWCSSEMCFVFTAGMSISLWNAGFVNPTTTTTTYSSPMNTAQPWSPGEPRPRMLRVPSVCYSGQLPLLLAAATRDASETWQEIKGQGKKIGNQMPSRQSTKKRSLNSRLGQRRVGVLAVWIWGGGWTRRGSKRAAHNT